jgi:large subunit ribosomal protein L22
MESLTYFKNVKITPKKLRMIRDNIAQMTPQDALDHLNYMTLKSAKLLYISVHSAIANATSTLKVSPDVLKFKLLTIEEGRKLKRFRAGSRGMAKPLVKRYSHIKIILEAVEVAKPKKKIEPKKKAVKKVTKRST